MTEEHLAEYNRERGYGPSFDFHVCPKALRQAGRIAASIAAGIDKRRPPGHKLLFAGKMRVMNLGDVGRRRDIGKAFRVTALDDFGGRNRSYTARVRKAWFVGRIRPDDLSTFPVWVLPRAPFNRAACCKDAGAFAGHEAIFFPLIRTWSQTCFKKLSKRARIRAIKSFVLHELGHGLFDDPGYGRSRDVPFGEFDDWEEYASQPNEVVAELTAIQNILLPELTKHGVPPTKERFREAMLTKWKNEFCKSDYLTTWLKNERANEMFRQWEWSMIMAGKMLPAGLTRPGIVIPSGDGKADKEDAIR